MSTEPKFALSTEYDGKRVQTLYGAHYRKRRDRIQKVQITKDGVFAVECLDTLCEGYGGADPESPAPLHNVHWHITDPSRWLAPAAPPEQETGT